MDCPEITVQTEGITVEGRILKREKFYIEVEITKPFSHFKSVRMITGMCRGTKDHFLTERGDEVALDILENLYSKLEMIDSNIERYVSIYEDYLSEIAQTAFMSKHEVSDRVSRKLEDWLFHTLFVSSVTNLIASYNEREQLFNILEAYRNNRVKLYLASDDAKKYTKNGWRIILP